MSDDEIEETNTTAEVAHDILLVRERLEVCQWVYGRIRREWAGQPYWPAKAAFKTERDISSDDLRVEIHFDSTRALEDEGRPFQRAFQVPWDCTKSSALVEVWDRFVAKETPRLRQHFAAAIGVRLVQDEREEARNAKARAEREPAPSENVVERGG